MATKFDPLVNCLNLRCKQMTYQVDDDRSADDVDEGERDEDFDMTVMYWCECTQTGRGPDDKPVARTPCSSRDRGCFEGIQDLT